MKTPTLAQLRRLAKRKGMEIAQRETLAHGVEYVVSPLPGNESQGRIIGVTFAWIENNLSALPDAETAKGGA